MHAPPPVTIISRAPLGSAAGGRRAAHRPRRKGRMPVSARGPRGRPTRDPPGGGMDSNRRGSDPRPRPQERWRLRPRARAVLLGGLQTQGRVIPAGGVRPDGATSGGDFGAVRRSARARGLSDGGDLRHVQSPSPPLKRRRPAHRPQPAGPSGAGRECPAAPWEGGACSKKDTPIPRVAGAGRAPEAGPAQPSVRSRQPRRPRDWPPPGRRPSVGLAG